MSGGVLPIWRKRSVDAVMSHNSTVLLGRVPAPCSRYASAVCCSLLTLVSLLLCPGCGGGGSPLGTPSVLPVPAATPVEISAQAGGMSTAPTGSTEVVLPVNQTLSIVAYLAGTSNVGVTWTAGGVRNGSPDFGTIEGSGLTVIYRAPASLPQTNPIVVRVTSEEDARKSASITVTITRPDDRGPTVEVAVTSDDETQLMQPQPSVSFSSDAGGGNTVVVDENQVYQRIEGFGAAFTDSAAYLLNEVAAPAEREKALNSLFTRDGNGIGLSFMRNPIGASDMARTIYSFDDMPSGDTDPQLKNFSIAHDQLDILPIIHRAKQLNPQLQIVASPWSPPGWMKTTKSLIGGSLLPDAYDAFAQYFVKYLQAYAAAGVPIDYITLQNEPLGVPPDYPGMLMDAPTQTVILRDHVLPALAANNIATKVLIYDHDWLWPDFPAAILSDRALLDSGQVAGIAWHGYSGTPGVQGEFPTKGNYVTEHSGGIWVPDQVKSDFEEITQVMRNGGKTYVKWNLALDENRGPHTGGGSTCNPLVTVNSETGSISYPIDYYTLGHFSKYVVPGASRIYSSNANGLVSVAFINPDNSKVLVVFNDGTISQMFQVQWGAQTFKFTLHGSSAATFSWDGTQAGGYTLDARSQIQASSLNSASGLRTEVTTDTNGGYDVGFADDGDYAVYKNVDFGPGVTQVTVRVASGGNGGRIEFHLDDVEGPIVASVDIPSTGGWQSWTTVSATALGGAGIHDVFATFKGSENIGNLNWFRFN